MNEAEVVKKTLTVLSRHFSIDQEVWSVDHQKRIDVIVRCKLSGVHFGIEFKHTDKKRGENLGKLIIQASDYSKRKFCLDGVNQIIPIFIAPPVSIETLVCVEEKRIIDGHYYYRDRHEPNHSHHTVNGMLGALNIGEIRTIRTDNLSYFVFSFSNKTIWSSRKMWGVDRVSGLHQANYDKLMAKIR